MASLIFIIFTAFYILLSIAVVYHLKQYTLPGHRAPRMATAVFFSLAGVLWIAALILLFRI